MNTDSLTVLGEVTIEILEGFAFLLGDAAEDSEDLILT